MSKFNFNKGFKSGLRYHLIEYYSHRYLFMRGTVGSINPFAIFHLQQLKKELSTIKVDATFIEQIKHHTVIFTIKQKKLGRPELIISKVLATI